VTVEMTFWTRTESELNRPTSEESSQRPIVWVVVDLADFGEPIIAICGTEEAAESRHGVRPLPRSGRRSRRPNGSVGVTSAPQSKQSDLHDLTAPGYGSIGTTPAHSMIAAASPGGRRRTAARYAGPRAGQFVNIPRVLRSLVSSEGAG
jgi:hypothetical protein